MKTKKYKFSGKVWKYKGPAGWHFVTLPKALAVKIRKHHAVSEEGWGRLRAVARIRETNWKTAIWFDRKAKSYLLPIKAIVRRTNQIESGKTVQVTLSIETESFNPTTPMQR